MVLENNRAPEIAAAIAYFEEAVRESEEILSKCSPALRAELTEQRRHFVAALGALKRETAEPPNAPLTLEELRGMVGEPVWVTRKDGSGGRWGILNIYPAGMCADVKSGSAYWFVDYVGTLAYRRKPDGGGE